MQFAAPKRMPWAYGVNKTKRCPYRSQLVVFPLRAGAAFQTSLASDPFGLPTRSECDLGLWRQLIGITSIDWTLSNSAATRPTVLNGFSLSRECGVSLGRRCSLRPTKEAGISGLIEDLTQDCHQHAGSFTNRHAE